MTYHGTLGFGFPLRILSSRCFLRLRKYQKNVARPEPPGVAWVGSEWVGASSLDFSATNKLFFFPRRACEGTFSRNRATEVHARSACVRARAKGICEPGSQRWQWPEAALGGMYYWCGMWQGCTQWSRTSAPAGDGCLNGRLNVCARRPGARAQTVGCEDSAKLMKEVVQRLKVDGMSS